LTENTHTHREREGEREICSLTGFEWCIIIIMSNKTKLTNGIQLQLQKSFISGSEGVKKKRKKWLNFHTKKKNNKSSLPPLVVTSKEDHKPEESRRTTLDGFILLERGHVEFPEELEQVDLCGFRLTNVVEQDLSYFTNLKAADFGENELSIESLSGFSSLEELHLYCNNVRRVPRNISVTNSFEKLRVLNLSYNLLTCEELSFAVQFHSLEELDLTGNTLRSIPKNIGEMAALKILNISSNMLEQASDWHALAQIPNLRELNASKNEFKTIPATTRESFPQLQWINVAHNRISDEGDLKGLMSCTRLFCIVLHDNPLTLSTAICRSEVMINGRVVSLVTDPPPPTTPLFLLWRIWT
jgi:Leucine-rich repeat (LRR) protein